MNTQFIIDLPTLVLALSLYFSMKGLYHVLRYFCPDPDFFWRSGYLAGHNALADKLKPNVKDLVKNWEKIKVHMEELNNSVPTTGNKVDDRKVSGQEQNL